MAKQFKTVLLFGGPGVGKGTQGKSLGAIPGFFHHACGDVFRKIDRESELGKVFVQHSSRGELVPDDVTVRMWHAAIKEHIEQCDYAPASDLLVLDGIPRTTAQVELTGQHIDVERVVHLTCTNPEAMFQRLHDRAMKEGRQDDADDSVIRRRWDVYQAETAPVLACYPPSTITDVDAIGTPADVLMKVLAIVAPIQAAHTRGE